MNFPEPRFEFVPGTDRIRLIEDWLVGLEYGLYVIVPVGFETDGASVPRLFQNVMSPWGNLRHGAIIHDFFYQYGYLLSPMTAGSVFNIRSLDEYHQFASQFGDLCPVYIDNDREFADKLFRHVVEFTSEAPTQAAIAYRLLRLCGWRAWNKYRKHGPGAYNVNSLGLPGIIGGKLCNGVA